MKRLFSILTALVISLSFWGCSRNIDKRSSETIEKQETNQSTALQLNNSTPDYDTDLKVFIVDGHYLEVQWTFKEGAKINTENPAIGEHDPKVQLSFACGQTKENVDMELSYCYYAKDGENSPLTLSQIVSSATLVLNNAEVATFDISKEIQSNTLIFRVKAPEGNSLDFNAFKWFATNIYYGYDRTNGTSKEYTDSEVVCDYSLNPYPNPEYAQAKPLNAPREVSFDGKSFTVDSEYYTIAKFEVPKVRVFDYIWYYFKAWDQWSFEARDERQSSITEYQITSYDSTGNVLSRETRTMFPSQEDLLSCFRGVIGYSESVKDMSISTTENREKAVCEYYAASETKAHIDGNTLYNGGFFSENVEFSGSRDLSKFKPESSGYAYASVPYQYQVEGGYIDGVGSLNVTVYYSNASLVGK